MAHSAPRLRRPVRELIGDVVERRRGVDRSRALFGASSVLAALGVLYVHGFLPGMSQSALTSTMSTGAIQCLRDQGVASLWTWCMSVGVPIGAPKLTGLPQTYAGWLLTYLPGVDAWTGHQISSGACVVAGLVAGYLLLRRWGAPRWIALLFAAAALTSLNIVILNGFGFTFVGYMLVPAYVLVALTSLDWWSAGHGLRAAVVTVGVCLLMVFTDGYSFFGAGIVIGCLVAAWAVRRWRGGARLEAGLAVATWALAAGGSAFLYTLWVPGDAFGTSSDLEVFGLFGVDLVTLFVPRSTMLIPALFGISTPTLSLWGGAASIQYNYLGYLCLSLAAGLLVAMSRAARRRRELARADVTDARTADAATESAMDGAGRARVQVTAEMLAVGVAGVIALLLSLGPVLKVGQTAPGLDAAVMELPTAWLYENVPGLAAMRAVYRWHVVTRWCLLLLAAGGLTALWRGWRGTSRARAVVVVLIAVLAVAEVAPDLMRQRTLRENAIEHVAFLREGIVAEADEMLVDGETILLLPAGDDFLVNYMVPVIGVSSYNAGIDKNYSLALANWPKTVRATVATYPGPDTARHICAVLANHADAVVLAYPDLRSVVLPGVTDAEGESERRAVADELAQDPRFDVERGEWMTVLRAADGSCVP